MRSLRLFGVSARQGVKARELKGRVQIAGGMKAEL
jgi:hypothetical protein